MPKTIKKVARNEWKPVSKMQLKHKINNRNVFVAKFKSRKTYDFDEVVKFVKKMRKNLKGGISKAIQIGFELSNNQFYSSKMTDINDKLEIGDFRNLYVGHHNLIGFSIFLS